VPRTHRPRARLLGETLESRATPASPGDLDPTFGSGGRVALPDLS